MSKLILIGCGKAKGSETCPALDLYTGPIFRARRAYAEASGEPWMILSAKYGMIRPRTWVAPYDLTVKDLSKDIRSILALHVARQLVGLGITRVELHMGWDYAGLLIPVLESVGIRCSWPVKGLSQGHQLQWYKQQRETLV